MSDETRLAICLPQTDQVAADYACSLMSMAMRLALSPIAEKVITVARRSTLISLSRCYIARDAIRDGGATHLLWIDADHAFPPDTAHRLMAHKKPIVGINAVTRRGDIRFTATGKDNKHLVTHKDSTGLEEVSSVGFGIALVEARVFLSLDQPWFSCEWMPDEDMQLPDDSGGGVKMRGEDLFFCEKAKAQGFEILVDHDLSKDTAHIGQVAWEWEDAKVGTDDSS